MNRFKAVAFPLLSVLMALGEVAIAAPPPVSNAQSYFVSVGASDSNPGTMTEPFATIGKGLAAASADPVRKRVLVSQGTYSEAITLPNGVSLYGSYNAFNSWARSSSYATTITSTNTTVQVSNYTTTGVLEGFTILSTGASPGQNSVSLQLNNAPGLTVRFNTLQSATVAAAPAAATASTGASGGGGFAGLSGFAGGQGGIGGTSACNAGGGNGGSGGYDFAYGANGASSQTGALGGLGSSSSNCLAYGYIANQGLNGGAATDGTGGAGGSGGVITGGAWVTDAGDNGSAGTRGGGAGGGGGGGGAQSVGFFCSASRGGGGGGGGGGGCGGSGGVGASGGAGSFAILVVGTSGAVIVNNTIRTGNGGAGGAGAAGGFGGSGGVGGAGAFSGDVAGTGGRGGDGIAGGRGGGGGGGAGGPSVGIYASASTVNEARNLFTIGAGGAGGNAGLPNGLAGSAGTSAPTVGTTTAPSYSLNIAVQGTGAGTVNSVFGGVDCGAGCSLPFGSGAELALIATPSAGSTFIGWGGECTGTGICALPMNSSKNVSARFDASPNSADVTISQVASSNPGSVGKDLVFTMTVSNNGPAAATGVAITAPIPSGSSHVWASPGCNASTGTAICSAGTLVVGASKIFKLVVRPTAAGSVTNNANVAADQPEPIAANNNSSMSVNVVSTPAGTPVLRYRLYSPVTLEHHFTTDYNEYSVLGSNGNWNQEGTVGKVLNNPGMYSGVTAVPYYRLYNTSSQWHHWTTDANEYYTLLMFPGWSGEGVDGYLLPATTTGAVPLYRLLYPFVAGLHHWTIDPAEYNALITTYGWIGEGGSGFVVQ